MKLIIYILAILSLASCSSYFKRKTCESTNWFEYGQKVALEGRRLTGDQFIHECNQAEADVAEAELDRGFKSGMQKYCLPETVFQIGKNGQFFSSEMCTGSNLKVLMAQHKTGVTEYCRKSNGYAAGTKGEAYNKICPVEFESEFLHEFNRGRKRYLETVVNENQKQIHILEREVSRLQPELMFKKAELVHYQYNTKDEKAVMRFNEIRSQVRNLESNVNYKQSEISRLQTKNRSLQIEIVQLGN